MIDIKHLLEVADVYGRAENIEEKTISNRVFQDGKRLPSIREGKEITVGRFNAAMEWFSAHWPEGALWPDQVERPIVESGTAAHTPRRKANASSEQFADTDARLSAILDRIANQMAAEFGFTPSHLQVVQFLAKKTGFSL